MDVGRAPSLPRWRSDGEAYAPEGCHEAVSKWGGLNEGTWQYCWNEIAAVHAAADWGVEWSLHGSRLQAVQDQDVLAEGAGHCGMYSGAPELGGYSGGAQRQMEAHVQEVPACRVSHAEPASASAHSYTGFLKTFSPKDGYGFIDCPPLFKRFGRDVFIHAVNVPAGLSCGQSVSFNIDLNRRGQPQARDVSVCEEEAALLDEELSEACNHLLLSKLYFEALSIAPEPGANASKRPVRICSWNILAAAYASCKAYPDVRPSLLRWPRRRRLLSRGLQMLEADVFCLQEVDCAVADLNLKGFDHVFAPRPGGRVDQCIIAWRRDRFRLLSRKRISYDDHIPGFVDKEQTQRFRRGHCAAVVELMPSGGEPIVIATTHLCWAAEHEDVRAWQMQILLDELKPYMEGRCKHRAVLCGDLNALPGLRAHTCATELLTSVYADVETEAVTNSNRSVSPQGFAEMIDHMFFDPVGSAAVSRLRLPSRDELRKLLSTDPMTLHDAVPTLLCETWPSDHLPVAADMVFASG